jgi:hypothetical protein
VPTENAHRWLLAGSACALLVLSPRVGAAQADEQAVAAALKSIEDPTVLLRRTWVDTEWSTFKDSSDDIELTLGSLWAWRLSPDKDWGVRVKVPVKFHRAGSGPGDENEEGLGDLKVGVGAAVRFSPTLRGGGGLEMRFPTAQDDLGSNVWRPMLFGTVSWDATPGLTLSPSAEYNKSIKEENGAAPQHYLELFFPATFLLEGRWAVTPRYELKIDFANNDKLTRSGKLSVTKGLADQPLAFTLSIKKTFDDSDKKFQVNLVATRFFR